MFTKLHILKPLEFKDFRWLFAAQLTNNLAMFLDYIALSALLVFQWHKGIITLAGFSVVYALPMIMSPFAGTLVDRWALKRTMICSSAVTSVLTFSLFSAPDSSALIAIIFLRAFSKVFFVPAEKTLIKVIFPEEQLLKANSLVQFSLQFFRILGPIIGGAFLLIFSPKMLFVITGTVYLFSIFSLLKLPNKFNYVHSKPMKFKLKEYLKSTTDIFKVFFFNTKLAIAYTAMTLATFSFFLSESLNLLFARKIGFSEHTFQLILVAMGVGCVCAAFIIGRKKKDNNMLTMILYGMFLMGTAFISASIFCHLLNGFLGAAVFLLIWFIIGACISIMGIPYSVIVMKELSKNMMGKASSMGNLNCGVSLLLAPVIGAFIAKNTSIHLTFAITGIVLSITSLTFLFFIKKCKNYKFLH